MNIIDVVVVLAILMSGIVGFKRGVFKELVMTVGYLIVFVIAYILKNPLAEWLSFNLPFFKFGNVFMGIGIINVIFYQFTSFIIIFSLIMIIFKIVLTVTNIFEKILKYTIVLGIPSKILGLIVGLIEGYIIGFCIMFFFAGPMFGDITYTSKLKEPMLKNTPILAPVVKEFNDTIIDIYNLRSSTNNKEQLEEDITIVMLKHKIVNYNYLVKLNDTGKINVDKKVLDEYK